MCTSVQPQATLGTWSAAMSDAEQQMASPATDEGNGIVKDPPSQDLALESVLCEMAASPLPFLCAHPFGPARAWALGQLALEVHVRDVAGRAGAGAREGRRANVPGFHGSCFRAPALGK